MNTAISPKANIASPSGMTGTDIAPKVLLVDDELGVLKALARTYKSAGYNVRSILDARAAVSLLSSWPPDAIVADYRMPGLDGVSLLAQAKQLSPNAARILMTGYGEMGVALQAVNAAGVHRLLSKPLERDELLEATRTAIADCEYQQKAVWELDAERSSNQVLKARNKELEKKTKTHEYVIHEKEKILRSNYGATIRTLLMALESRRPGAAARAHEVAHIASMLARELNESWVVEAAATAGLLCEVGYLASPAMPPRVPSMSTDREHCTLGSRMLQNSMFSGIVSAAVEAHHENWNGSGPLAYSGMQIPFVARCLRAADLIADYIGLNEQKNPIPKEALISLIDGRNGRELDPGIAAECVKIAHIKGVREFTTRGLNRPVELSDFEIPVQRQ